MLGQIRECNIGPPLTDHQMHGNQVLEDDGPRRVAEAILQRAEDVADAGLAGVGGYQYMLDIFRLGRGGLDLGGTLDRLFERARHC